MASNRRTPPDTSVDPLGDLRTADATGVPLEGVAAEADGTVTELTVPSVFAAAWHQDAAAAIVARWHDDRTAARILHKGQVCGCRNLAALALLASVGIALEPVEGGGDNGNGA